MSTQKESDREEALRLSQARIQAFLDQERKDMENGGIRLRGWVWKTDDAGTSSARLYRYQDGEKIELPLSSLTADEANGLVAVIKRTKAEEKDKSSNKLLVVLLIFAFVLGVVFPPVGVLLLFAAVAVWWFIK